MTTVAIELSTPDVHRLDDVVRTLQDWQRDTAPMQLHPGDLGWHWRLGAEATAAAVRTWSRHEQLLAIGFLDGPNVLRMTVAADAWRDEELARQVVADAAEPQRGVLPEGTVCVETPDGTRVQDLFAETGWSRGESWTPLRRDLAEPVEQPRLRITVIVPGQESAFTAVHRSAWGSQRFTDEVWRVMTTGLPFTDARCLLGHDDQDIPVAGATVWSAGPGKPGLLEPMGVHVDHRRRGYGRAICVAAAAELRRLGSSSAMVCTESARTAAVAAYRSAGFQQLPERLDLSRDA
jgi:ribosomal protein S18 acetylase RimI-like enzyme